MRYSRLALSCLASVSIAAMASSAYAQGTTTAAPAPAPAPVTAPDAEVEVVVITATKRETTLQATPVAVSVTTAQTIAQAQVRDLNDIQTLVPSLRISTNQSSTNATFTIRGFGNGANNAGIEPSVAVFIDGVYRSRAAAAIGDLPNIQRVEVLRGPQSTLFGKNASAGVISLVTREPRFELGGAAEISYGNFNAIVAKADITGPLGENAAGALAFGYNKRDGYVENIGLGQKINDRNRFNIRGDILIRPSDALKVRLIADYDSFDELCCAVANVLSGPASAAIKAIGGNLVENSAFGDRVFSDVSPTNYAENRGFSAQVDYEFGKYAFTSISAYRNSFSDADGDVDYTSASLASVPQIQDISTYTQEFRLTSNFDGPVNFLLGAYLFKEDISQQSAVVYGKDFRNYVLALTGGAASPVLSIEAALGRPRGTFFAQGTGTTEEFGLENDSQSIFGTIDFELGEQVTFTGGFNYTKDSKTATTAVKATEEFAQLDLIAFGAGFLTNALTPVLGAANASNYARSISATRCPAVQPPGLPICNAFLGLTAVQFQRPFLNIPNAVESGVTSDSNTSYSARVAWEINDNFNAYASYATGFKASSFNLSRDSRPTPADFIPGSPVTLPPPAPSAIRTAGLALPNLGTGSRFAGPEEATVIEVGLKARFPKGAFNLTYFDQQIDGFQSNAFTGTGFILANAGTQSTKGVEFDATYRPIRPLVLTAAITYLDPLFDDFKGGAYGDYSGLVPAGVSEWNVNTSATYVQPLANDGRITYRADYFWTSETQLIQGLLLNSAAAIPDLNSRNAANRRAAEAFTFQPKSLNASISYATPNGWEFTAWGRNITDERFLTTIFDSVAQDGSVSGYPSPPRTYGVSAKYTF